MEHSPDGYWDEVGCFVYKVVCVCSIRYFPSVSEETRIASFRSFKVGELVSVDLIKRSYTDNSDNGPFLRLSDSSGWLFERKESKVMMERMDVEDALWCFYADNYPAGIGLRTHPIDEPNLVLGKDTRAYTFLPMQKLFCDKKVRAPNGVNFFRAQGTSGWVFDKRGDGYMLLEEDMVDTGLFAYRALCNITIRNKTMIGDECKTLTSVQTGNIAVVDCIRRSPHLNGNGPFLRLANGSGWLFESKHNEKLMEAIPIDEGQWTLKVTNLVGIVLREQPIDENFKTTTIIRQGETCECDRRIVCPSSRINFYRVNGLGGWIFDKRMDHTMLELISSSSSSLSHISNNPSISRQSWTVDFVRGMAAAIEGLNEIEFNSWSHHISFQNMEQTRINVYYTTRTVGTSLDHPTRGKTNIFRRDCTNSELAEVMRNPQVQTGRGYQQKRSGVSSEDEEVIDPEWDMRRAILKCDKELYDLRNRKVELLKAVKEYDDSRKVASLEFDEMRKSKKTEEQKKRLQIEQEKEAERERDDMKRLILLAEEAERRQIREATSPACQEVLTKLRNRKVELMKAVNEQQLADIKTRKVELLKAIKEHNEFRLV